MTASTRADIEYATPRLPKRSCVERLQRAFHRKEFAAIDGVGNTIASRNFDNPVWPTFEMVKKRPTQRFVMLHWAKPPEPVARPLQGMAQGKADFREVPAAHD